MRHASARLALASLVALAACEVPTSVPKYDTEWDVPADSTSISVNSLLPSGVTATPDNSGFEVTVSPSTTTITRQLSQDCSACAVSNGLTIPKPAFVGGGSSAIALPASVGSATLARDTVTLSVTNGFNFDPIRPSATARGYLIIQIASGSAVVGRDSVDGSTTAISPGATVIRKIALNGTLNGAAGLQVTTTLNSPAGDLVAMDASRSITVSGSVGQLLIAAAQVSIAGQAVSAAASTLDLSSVGNSVGNHANGGSLMLNLNNPFAVTGNINVTITGGDTPIVRSVALTPGQSAPVITFSSVDIQGMIGHHLAVGFAGTLSGGSVTVQPGQILSVSSRLQIALNTVGVTN